MQQQSGFSNNFGQFQAQIIPQQGSGNNIQNNVPFGSPNNTGNMSYQNQQLLLPQNQFYLNQHQNSSFGNSSCENRSHLHDDHQPRGTVELNSISVGFAPQENISPASRKASGDEADGLSNVNKAQPDQDQTDKKPRKKKPKSGSNQEKKKIKKPEPGSHHGRRKMKKLEPESNQERKNIRNLTISMPRCCTNWKSGATMITIALCGVVVTLGILIGLVVFHFADKDVQLTSVAGGLNYMAFNLNSDPIMQLSWAQDDCPSGTDKIHLGAWPGSDNGCNCPYSGLSKGICGRKQTICAGISEIGAIDMFKWESSVFCAKRAQLGVDYIKTTSCPSGYKECSSSLCFVETLSCPISSITFSNTGDSSTMLVANKYVSFSNASGVTPIIDLDVSLNDVPCFSYTETPKGKGDYKLLNQRPEGCSTYGVDTEYSFKIDEMIENNLLINNNFPSRVFQLPDYQQVLNETSTVLSGRRRITVANKEECLTIKTEILNNAATAAADLNSYMTNTAIAAMILHVLLIIFVLASILKTKKKHGWGSAFKGSGARQWLYRYIFFTFSEFVVYIVMVVLINIARSHLLDSKGYLVGLDQMRCFPEGAPRKVIADYDDLVDQVASTLNGLAITLLGVSLLTLFPVAFILCYKKCREH